ncbi:isoaspartyl peptidase/L-asparaginase-like [Bombus flavifrons]|uniref:isoaspartyl peptidase/L-asparaginase-like n=1 Tax=Bombus flavifrons TaxID=103934 RepID=UPI0037042AF0
MCDYCSWIDQILARIRSEAKPDKKKRHSYVDPVIVVHGGAGKVPRTKRKHILFEVKNAAIEAYSDLINGRSAVDAVEKGIVYMESKPFFNCAKGGSLDVNDEIVTDAAIMTIRNAGCVGAVRDIEHPISLARKVLEKTEHVLIVENGAQKFALDNGISILPPGSLNISESLMSNFESLTCCMNEEQEESEWRNDAKGEKKECDSDCFINRSQDGEAYPYCVLSADLDWDDPITVQVSAVGVVAYDRKKRLASGTSTAGEPRKPVGSISSIGTVIGCGIYTDEHGCTSVSGNDTSIYCYAPARRIVKKLSEDISINTAVNTVLQNFENETGESHIGAIALDAKGEPCVSFNCTHFPWAFCQKGYVYYGMAQNEKYWEKITILERPLDCMCISSDDED